MYIMIVAWDEVIYSRLPINFAPYFVTLVDMSISKLFEDQRSEPESPNKSKSRSLIGCRKPRIRNFISRIRVRVIM